MTSINQAETSKDKKVLVLLRVNFRCRQKHIALLWNGKTFLVIRYETCIKGCVIEMLRFNGTMHKSWMYINTNIRKYFQLKQDTTDSICTCSRIPLRYLGI